MKTNEALMTEYKATEDQVGFAFENAMVCMQDKYGYDNVTDEFLFSVENDKEFSELVESSLESIVMTANGVPI